MHNGKTRRTQSIVELKMDREKNARERKRERASVSV